MPTCYYIETWRRLSLGMIFVSMSLTLCLGQWYMDVTAPSQISPCERYPLDVILINDDGRSSPSGQLTLQLTTGLMYDVTSLTGARVLDDSDPEVLVLEVPIIEPCESHRIQILMDPSCADEDRTDAVSLLWEVGNGKNIDFNTTLNIFQLSLQLSDIEIYYDSTLMSFVKEYRIINDGKVPIYTFTFYVDGEDNMVLQSTNIGTMSANGDTLYFQGSDFLGIGNSNDVFEPGEVIPLIQEIDLNACEESFPFSHVMEAPCGDKTCTSTVNNASELEVTIGQPLLLVRSLTTERAGFCDTGEICLIITTRSLDGSFPQANAAYDISINLGWSVVQGGRRTDPRRDNCLNFIEATIDGQPFAFQTGGFSGWGIDFTRFNSDPDGPGGLRDVDGDGRFDDLMNGDTVKVTVKYSLRTSCLNIGCNNRVFDSRILRLQADYTNYCDEDFERDQYLGNHHYFWNENGASVLNLDGVYADGDNDTLNIRINKGIGGFLQDCPNDSMIIRIDFPRVMSIPNNAIITVNGDTVNYRFVNRRLTITTDTFRSNIQIPVVLTCETNGGGGGVQTACTFCLGSGLATYRLRVEADYFCGNGCTPRIPLICQNSSQFYSLCDPDAKGIVSDGKLVVDELNIERQSLGYSEQHKDSGSRPNGRFS